MTQPASKVTELAEELEGKCTVSDNGQKQSVSLGSNLDMTGGTVIYREPHCAQHVITKPFNTLSVFN